MLPYVLSQWRGLLVILVLTACMAGVTALLPWPIKIIVDNAVGSVPLPVFVSSYLEDSGIGISAGILIAVAGLLSFSLYAINALLDITLTWIWSLSGQRMVYDLAADLFEHLQRLSLSFYSSNTVGDSLSRLTGDTWSTYKLASALLISPAQHLFVLVTVGTVAWAMDPFLTAILLAVAPALAASAHYFGRGLMRRSKQHREAQAQLTSFIHQTLTAIPLVHAFASEPRNIERFEKIGDEVVQRTKQGVLGRSAFSFVNGFAMVGSIAFVLYFGGMRVLDGALSVGGLLVFIAYAQTMKTSFGSLLNAYGDLKTVEAGIDRVLEVLDSKEAVQERADAQVLAVPFEKQGVAVQLDQVTFGYRPGTLVLDNVTLDAQPGETIALVGATGAGKSTLVSLIPRFFDPWSGRVLVDGFDVRELTLASLRSQIALVLQEPFLMPLAVSENIAYGRPSASFEEIEAAAVAANADEFIQQLPQGYDTVIGERGANLSGGQRQRLAIARALLKDAPILILDEPTSALDTRTETLLLVALERLMANRTTFIVAHRLSTIRNADRIVVLEGGKIVETDTHKNLLAQQGHYYRYYQDSAAATASTPSNDRTEINV
jgi:ATP-binding cassette subfamily B protein/subfamily B ATP-binding cassette protein MsbA